MTGTISDHIHVVVQFYTWFNFDFLLFYPIVIYDNDIKQRNIKIKPRIKLNYNIHNISASKNRN